MAQGVRVQAPATIAGRQAVAGPSTTRGGQRQHGAGHHLPPITPTGAGTQVA